MIPHLPAWLPAIASPVGFAVGWLARHYTLVRKLMKGAPMSTTNNIPSVMALISAGIAFAKAALQERQILANTALTDEQKAEQMASVAAAAVPAVLGAFPAVPKEIITMLADVQLDTKLVQAGEVAIEFAKEVLPHKAETPEGQAA